MTLPAGAGIRKIAGRPKVYWEEWPCGRAPAMARSSGIAQPSAQLHGIGIENRQARASIEVRMFDPRQQQRGLVEL